MYQTPLENLPFFLLMLMYSLLLLFWVFYTSILLFKRLSLFRIFIFFVQKVPTLLCLSRDKTKEQSSKKTTLILTKTRASPSTRPIRQLSKAPKWKGAPKFQKRRGSRGKQKKKKFQINYKNLAHPFNQKIKILVDPIKYWF